MKLLRKASSMWLKIVIIIGASVLCLQINNVAYAIPTITSDPIAEALDLIISVATAANALTNLAGKALWILKWGIIVGVVADVGTLLAQVTLTATEGNLYDQNDTGQTQSSMGTFNNEAYGNPNNFTNQLANYNQPVEVKSSDVNSLSGDPITYSATSANTLLGGSKVYSADQNKAAGYYVKNSTGAGIGLSKPNDTWRTNTTPEAVRYNAYYNMSAANQSQTAQALVGIQSKSVTPQADNPDGLKSTSSQHSSDALSMTVCESKSNPFIKIGCMVASMAALAPTVLKMGFNMFSSTMGLLGGLNTTASSAMSFGVLDPMFKQATDSAAGSQSNAYKKSSS